MTYINEGDFTIMVLTFIVLCIAVILALCLYGMYCKLITLKNKVKEAMSGIDVQLNKRYSLIPNILTIANKFMEHERELFQSITELRSQASSIRSTQDTIAKKIDLDNQIAAKMGQLMVNVENYPQLKSDQTMMNATQTYAEVEEHIAAARRFYNSAVNEINNAIEIFPSSIIAGMLGMKIYPFFEANEAARQEINAANYFN